MSDHVRMKDLIDAEADLDDEEEEDGAGEEDEESHPDNGRTRTRRRRRRGAEDDADSSEEEDDDDDEEEARKVREGFIVEDEDEDEDDDAEAESDVEPVIKKKRKRRERVQYEELDDDDFDLIGEQTAGTEPEMKRLKQRHPDDDRRGGGRALDDIFADEDEDAGPGSGPGPDGYGRTNYRHQQPDEFDDFIEEDYSEDAEDELQRHQEDIEVSRTRRKVVADVADPAGQLDKDALEDMEAIFANAEDYDWALQMEAEMETQDQDDQPIELKDVFEPSQLKDRMLTDEDQIIRTNDEPERFQLDRKPLRGLQLTPEQFRDEARWIGTLMRSNIPADLVTPYTRAIGKVLEFLTVDDLEVPFIFHHRKDYLIHTRRTRPRDRADRGDRERDRERDRDRDRDGAASADHADAEKLLTQDDLWRILELDTKYRSLIDKRNALQRAYDGLKLGLGITDETVEEMMPDTNNMEEIQDLQDYLHFQYATELRDLAAMAGGPQAKRPGAKASSVFERIRHSRCYRFVSAYGISADQLGRNVLHKGQKVVPDDDPQYPADLAESLVDDDFATPEAVITAARQMYAEELFMSPRMRKAVRQAFYEPGLGLCSCSRTDKGLRKIHESHPFYEIKYLMNQTFQDLGDRPSLFLKMVRAEEEGLVQISITLHNEAEWRRHLYREFESDNFSEKAEQWTEERRRVLDMAIAKLERVVAKAAKESLRTACQDEVLKACREEYFRRLDQAPFKPKALDTGEIPRVLALSNGNGDPGRDPVVWVWVDEEGRVLKTGTLTNLGRDPAERDRFADMVTKLRPDVIGVSGWSAATHRLIRDLENLVSEKRLMGPSVAGDDEPDRRDRDDDAMDLDEYDDDDNDLRAGPLQVVVVNDEVARLYKDSPRARRDSLGNADPLIRYCVALARYMQSPLKEYAALGPDITSLSLHPCQGLLPQARLLKVLEQAMIDMVNLCGVNINDAVRDPYTQNLLQYVAGLGPRKAPHVVKTILSNGGIVTSRDELVGDPDSGKLPVVGPRIWNNLASFLHVTYDQTNRNSDPLDSTRVHPEDYELGRKMAADALELDEEDVKAETDTGVAGAIVRKLFRLREQDKVNELVLEEYAEQLERRFHQKKRATLENIRAELQNPYEEIRNKFCLLTAAEIFTQLTGETSASLCRDMVVPANVRLVKDDFAIVRLDSGIEGRIESHEMPERLQAVRSIREILQVGQTIQAKILDVVPREFAVRLTMREEAMRRPYRPEINHGPATWDYELERRDREDMQEKDRSTGRAQRVINHPLFRPYNSTQAEEYLGSQPNGEVVIRTSSKGNDHLALTWKVADGIFQHVDVLELQKDNEFSLGRALRVGKQTFSDLDEVIVDYVKAMSRKVEDLMRHEKFEPKSRAELDMWLTTYVAANQNRSAYAFCLDPKHPGFFSLVFKIDQNRPVMSWPVKVSPQAYEMLNTKYPDTRALCNGFKLRYQHELSKMSRSR